MLYIFLLAIGFIGGHGDFWPSESCSFNKEASGMLVSIFFKLTFEFTSLSPGSPKWPIKTGIDLFCN